jgi:glutaconyl-CoA/methylmalonyl-CoA decarboxylase subunit gamma
MITIVLPLRLKEEDNMSKYIIKVNGNPYEVEVEEVGGASTNIATVTATKTTTRTSAPNAVKTTQPSSNSSGDISAPMPGTVLKVKVTVGDTVKKGQVLLILEAMKMENEIVSPVDGKVAKLNVEAGKSVTAGEVMVSIA